MQVYQSYIVDELLQKKLSVLLKETIDKSDETYLAWTNNKAISLKEYIAYAIQKRWIDVNKIPSDITYIDSEQANQLVKEEIITQLRSDPEFSKKIYR
jgi:penicillin-binding protein 2